MKVGFSRLKITAPLGENIIGYPQERPADGILDDLYVTSVAFSDGENTIVAITMDILELSKANCDIIKNSVAEKNGINADGVLVHCIHTHTGPQINNGRPEYVDYFFKRVCDSATFAIADLKEAKMYVATGEAKNVSFIRRYLMEDGSMLKYIRGQEDADKVVAVDGIADETVQLVKITREGAHDIAIVNFQTHPDTIAGNKFSADFVHFVRLTLEQALVDEADGKGVKVAYFNGAEGDMANRDLKHLSRRGYNRLRHIGRVIAAGVLSVYTYAEPIDCEKVTFKQAEVGMFVRDESVENREWRELRVSCIAAGDLAFIGLPGEPFVEIGRRIKANSAFKMTIPCCNANDWFSYLPMRESFRLGGYGVDGRHLNPDIADNIIDAAINLTKELKK